MSTLLWVSSAGLPLLVLSQPLGAPLTILQVNAGGTDVQWVSPGSVSVGLPINVPEPGASTTPIIVDTTAVQSILSLSSTGAVVLGGHASVSAAVNGTTALQLGATSTDFAAFGASPAGAGFLRVPSGSQNIIQSPTGLLFGQGSTGGAVINAPSGQNVQIANNASAVLLQLGALANDYAAFGAYAPTSPAGYLRFNWTGISTTIAAFSSGTGNFPFVGINTSGSVLFGHQTASPSAQGASGALLGQAGASGNTGGSALLVSGPGGGGGGAGNQDGGIVMLFGGLAGTDQISFGGAQTSAGRGQVNFSQALFPKFTQAQQANGSNPNNFEVDPQAPGAGAGSTPTGTPGSFVVALATPVSTGNEAMLSVTRGGQVYGAIGKYPAQPYGAFWLGPATPSTTNYAFLADASTFTQFNAPTGGTIQFAIAASTWASITASTFTVATAGLSLSAISTAASASGGAATLPGSPVGFIVVSIGGTSRKIPYYAT
jgi:hypothetical protein